ncbi:MAG TPA: SdpI family protein [Anaerolineae bacterium]|nr:SdpI family protein [Anaerolineae bacterium]HQK14844.1 SdpI family protein [Anaerolineae bacterium]
MVESVPVGFMLFFVCTGLLLVGLSIPLLLRRIKPNYWYGLRVRKTLSDEHIWYESNAYMAKWLLFLGGLHTVVSFVLYFVPNLRTNLNAYAATCGIIFMLAFLLVIILSFRYLRTL